MNISEIENNIISTLSYNPILGCSADFVAYDLGISEEKAKRLLDRLVTQGFASTHPCCFDLSLQMYILTAVGIHQARIFHTESLKRYI